MDDPIAQAADAATGAAAGAAAGDAGAPASPWWSPDSDDEDDGWLDLERSLPSVLQYGSPDCLPMDHTLPHLLVSPSIERGSTPVGCFPEVCWSIAAGRLLVSRSKGSTETDGREKVDEHGRRRRHSTLVILLLARACDDLPSRPPRRPSTPLASSLSIAQIIMTQPPSRPRPCRRGAVLAGRDWRGGLGPCPCWCHAPRPRRAERRATRARRERARAKTLAIGSGSRRRATRVPAAAAQHERSTRCLTECSTVPQAPRG